MKVKDLWPQVQENQTINPTDTRFVSKWPDKPGIKGVPIIHVNTYHAFNRLVGYARFINAEIGTVLYRGQTEQHNSLSPSGARSGAVAVTNSEISKICSNNFALRFMGLTDSAIDGWNQYRSLIIESVLQHYGAKTYCMDFVDNHWCALWFGANEFINNHYHKRNINDNLYVFLYVADTHTPCIRGVYIGADSYTVDLRKALPSIFQRPASQHGWIVRNRERTSTELDDNVIGVLEVRVGDAINWLGEGTLLSEGNFFPSYTIDQGYRVLLSMQQKSGIASKKKGSEKLISPNTICNYHLSEMYYLSSNSSICPTKSISFIDITEKDRLSALFSVLLYSGWSKTTCVKETLWDENEQYKGQSAVTALLVNEYFGGDICAFQYGHDHLLHYYNYINGVVVDLTKSELSPPIEEYYQNPNEQIKSIKNAKDKYEDKLRVLIENCEKASQ